MPTIYQYFSPEGGFLIGVEPYFIHFGFVVFSSYWPAESVWMKSENTEMGSKAERLECCTITDIQFRKARSVSKLKKREKSVSYLAKRKSCINIVKRVDTSWAKACKYPKSALLHGRTGRGGEGGCSTPSLRNFWNFSGKTLMIRAKVLGRKYSKRKIL